jgi:hypothetical protein
VNIGGKVAVDDVVAECGGGGEGAGRRAGENGKDKQANRHGAEAG